MTTFWKSSKNTLAPKGPRFMAIVWVAISINIRHEQSMTTTPKRPWNVRYFGNRSTTISWTSLTSIFEENDRKIKGEKSCAGELGNGTSGLFSKLPNFCEPNHNDDERQNFNRLHIQLSSQDISHISHLNTIHIYPCPVFCLFSLSSLVLQGGKWSKKKAFTKWLTVVPKSPLRAPLFSTFGHNIFFSNPATLQHSKVERNSPANNIHIV